MRIATVDEIREIDSRAQSEFGLSSEILMEAAGALSARELEQSYLSEVRNGPTAVVCGPGGNGGDGLVLARHLQAKGYPGITVFIAAPESRQNKIFKIQLERARKSGVVIFDLFKHQEDLEQLKSYPFVVDAIFGVGLNSDVESPYNEIIQTMNSSAMSAGKNRNRERRPIVVSLDTPSGLNSDSGVVRGSAVRADMTLSFGVFKRGFFVSEGPAHAGKLRMIGIGLPKELVRSLATTHVAVSADLARSLLPGYKPTANKSNHGHASIFAGSAGTWGAALLASSSASRVGAGYVTLASNENPARFTSEMPECLTADATIEKFWQERKWKVAAVGPGLGTGRETKKIIERLKHAKVAQVVVDADALTVLSQSGELKSDQRLPQEWVLTPHAGELARILEATEKVSAKEIEDNRFHFAGLAAKRFGCSVLLKGFRTVVATPSGKCYVILAGNSALAKAGSGDVLTGMIVGLMAQGLKTPEATVLGAYLHGRVADEWVRSGRDKLSLQPSDIREILPHLIHRLRRGGEL